MGMFRCEPGQHTSGTGLLLATVILAAVPVGAALTDSTSAVPTEPSVPSFAVHETDEETVLLGEVDRRRVLQHFPAWAEEWRDYRPDSASVAELAGLTRPVEIICVLGTWCSDSEREVPRFWKVMDQAGNDRISLRMLAVGRRDDAEAARILTGIGFPAGIRDRYGIEFVPTFIFSEGDHELGRIVETPTGSLEQDAALLVADPEPAPDAPAWR